MRMFRRVGTAIGAPHVRFSTLLGVAGTVMASPAAFRGPALGARPPASSTGARPRGPPRRQPRAPLARDPAGAPRSHAPRARERARASSPRHRASIGVARRPRGRALRATDDANEPPGTASSAESSASSSGRRPARTRGGSTRPPRRGGGVHPRLRRRLQRLDAHRRDHAEAEQRLRDLAGVLGGVHVVAGVSPPRRPRRGGPGGAGRRRPRSWDSPRSWRCVSRPCRPRRRRRRGGDEKRRERRVRAREGGEEVKKQATPKTKDFSGPRCVARGRFSAERRRATNSLNFPRISRAHSNLRAWARGRRDVFRGAITPRARVRASSRPRASIATVRSLLHRALPGAGPPRASRDDRPSTSPPGSPRAARSPPSFLPARRRRSPRPPPRPPRRRSPRW